MLFISLSSLKLKFKRISSKISMLIGLNTIVSKPDLTEAMSMMEPKTGILENLENSVICYKFDIITVLIIISEIFAVLLVFILILKILFKIFEWYNFRLLNDIENSFYKYIMDDKTNIYIQFTSNYGKTMHQLYLGSVYGNPEDIVVLGNPLNSRTIDLEKHIISDNFVFNWNTFKLTLPYEHITLPFNVKVYFPKTLFMRSMYNNKYVMFRMIAHNPKACKVNILSKFVNLKSCIKLTEEQEIELIKKIQSPKLKKKKSLEKLKSIEEENSSEISSTDGDGTMLDELHISTRL